MDLSLYRALIESAVPKSITATTYLYIPDSSIRPGDVLRYNPARPHHVYRAHPIPIMEFVAALERAEAIERALASGTDPDDPLARPAQPPFPPGRAHLRLIP